MGDFDFFVGSWDVTNRPTIGGCSSTPRRLFIQ